jgi:[histone H3]-lysine4 N-trimethyltransferase ATXR3
MYGQRIGADWFHCHPKGTGVLCQRPEGIPERTFVDKYLGELYPCWRWNERLDAIEDAQARYGLKPELPDFYNMLLERPKVDSRGYGVLHVDAGRHVANLSSSLSHSCDPNCETAIVVRDGRLCIALTTTRAVTYREELTIDYFSCTDK